MAPPYAPMKTVYIAHPLAGDGSPEWGNVERNVERYLRFVAKALNEGYVVITWVHHYMTHTRGLTKGDFDFYLSRDCSEVRLADEFWEAGPVRVSKGMQVEHQTALDAGKPLRHDPEWDDPSYWPIP